MVNEFVFIIDGALCHSIDVTTCKISDSAIWCNSILMFYSLQIPLIVSPLFYTTQFSVRDTHKIFMMYKNSTFIWMLVFTFHIKFILSDKSSVCLINYNFIIFQHYIAKASFSYQRFKCLMKRIFSVLCLFQHVFTFAKFKRLKCFR